MSSMGMDKSGTQTLSPLSTWIKVLSFVVRSGYPSTSIVNSALVMDATATGDVRFRGAFTSSFGTQQFRIMKNGVTVLGSPANNGVTTTIAAQSFVLGDTIELWAFASASGFATVQTGAANTFVEFNQTSQAWTIGAAQTIGWAATAALTQSAQVDVASVIGWARTADLSQDNPIAASQTIAWQRDADIYQGIHYTIGASTTIGWQRSANLLHVHKILAPPSVFSFADVAVSVHTVDGRMVGDFPCNIIASFTWGRESVEVSTCELDIMTEGAPELIEELRPWQHWITIWHDDKPVWTGPIQVVRPRRNVSSISARDPATFMWRTRMPITRTWTDTAPARIADTLWQAMFSLHGIRANPVVLPGVADDTFTLSGTADQRMLNQFMDELVKVGLQWTVVSGRPVLGTFGRDPVAELAECDFMVDLERLRDGTATFNDVRVQGQNWAQTAIAPLAGLHLQTLVAMDDLFGASNIARATQLYARDSARIRDTLFVPASASLHPQAPVTMDDLVPGKVFIVHSEFVSQLMRLEQVTVSGSPDTFDVQVTLVALEEIGELATLTGGRTT